MEHLKFELFFHRQRPLVELISRRQGKTEWQWHDFRKRTELGVSTMHNTCVSYRHEKTVEVRTFKGTVFPHVAVACIQFVDAVIRFVQQHSVMLIDRKHACYVAFMEFIFTEHERYDSLCAYIHRLFQGVPYKEAA
jgi:hypothetical protein